MVKTITVSLPDELHAQLQEVKTKMNVSGVCQEALVDKVKVLNVAEDASLIEFLRAGKEEDMKEDIKTGRQSALECIEAKCIPYREFKAIAKLYAEMEMGNTPPDSHYDSLKSTVYHGLGSPVWDDVIEEEINNLTESDPSLDADLFCLGFVEKVAEVWAEIEDKI